MLRWNRLWNRLATVVWTAILVIAVQVVADRAFAHAGHSHDLRPSVTHSSALASPQAMGEVGNLSDEQPAASTVQYLSGVDAGTPEQSHPTQGSGCVGSCCGNSIGCCGALLAGMTNLPFDIRPAEDFGLVLSEGGSGIQPETLARPPKTLA